MPDPTDLPITPQPADEAPAAASADTTTDQPGDLLATPDHGPDAAGDDTTADGTVADTGAEAAEPATTSTAAGSPALPLLTPAAAAELLRQHFPALFAGPDGSRRTMSTRRGYEPSAVVAPVSSDNATIACRRSCCARA